MTRPRNTEPSRFRNTLALLIVVFSIAMVAVMALYLIAVILKGDAEAAKDTFKTVLPVFTAWVSTVLVFYFGQRSFETAAEQAQKLVRLSPEQRARSPISTIMRQLRDTVCYTIPGGESERDVRLSALRKELAGTPSRLPIVDAEGRPKYMIHESKLDKYVAGSGKESHSLEVFLKAARDEGVEFGLDHGFVMVSEDAPIADAKKKLEQIPFCQDIFITKTGGADEPLLGWVSNVRLGKYLEA